MSDTSDCKYCGHTIYCHDGRWVHSDGVAACPTATYAAPVLA